MGSNATTFDWAGAREISLASFLTISDKWFSSQFQLEAGVDVPFILGFEILEIDGKRWAYLIFPAGANWNAAYAGATARGFGAFKIALFD